MQEDRKLTYSSLPVVGSLRPKMDPRQLSYPVSQLLFSPNACWEKFRCDQRSAQRLFEDYVFTLALIPALSGFISCAFFGRTGIAFAFALALTGYAASIGFLLGAVFVAQRTAWLMGDSMSINTAAKLIIYSFMPFFLAGIFLIHPQMAFLSISGVCSLYLFFHGVRELTRLNPAQLLTYCALNIVVWIVVCDGIIQLIRVMKILMSTGF